MIIVPVDVKCVSCTKIFCCSDCRKSHEKIVHPEAVAARKQTEEMKRVCYICDGQKLPLGADLPFSSTELLQHVIDNHLPMHCGRCLKIFNTIDDLKQVNQCCLPALIEPIPDEPSEYQNKVDEKAQEIPEEVELISLGEPNKTARELCGDSRRHQSLITLEPLERFGKKRETSTPMANANVFIETASYSASSISSINFTNSTSSDSDVFSPPIGVVAKKNFVSPQRPPRSQPQARSRPRMSVHATPLRQVMSKSIQRALQEHGHYRESPFALQQRKVSFNSTNSSEERTTSLMKFPNETEDPLDLRTTPTRQRYTDEPFEERDLIEFSSRSVAVEQIEVIIRRSEIKSESSLMTSFKSAHSNVERSGSMPLLHITPKIVGNSLQKKTISFETPTTIEQTPSFLMAAISKKPQEHDDDSDDEVFSTPRASPYRAPFKRAVNVPSPIEEVNSGILSHEEGGSMDKENEGSNIWKFVTSVIKMASRKSEDSAGSTSSNDKAWSFGFKKPSFMQKAEDYFSKRSEGTDDQPSKRRRTGSNTGQTSPAMKRQKIQARKPIERMRKLS